MPKNNFTRLSIRLLSGLLFLGGALSLSENTHAQILINEDFSTASGFTAPSGWANVSLNSADPWDFSDNCGSFGSEFDAGSTSMSGNIAILNSDCTEDDQIAELSTSSFNAVGGAIMLEFDNSIQNWSSQLCQVDVWNGTVWTNVFSVNGADDGATSANHKSINITTATGNNPAAKVRFHYEGDYEYWWAIDNVKITKILCTAPTATFTVVPDCSNSQYSVSVNVSNLGSATSLVLSDGTNNYGSAITTTGTYIAGSFPDLSSRTLTLIHNDNVICNLNSANLGYNCTVPNDECSFAQSITPQFTCVTTAGSTAGTTVSSPAVVQSCYDDSPGNDVWYSFVAGTVTSLVSISNLQPTNTAAYLGEVGFSVYNNNCGNLGSPISCGFSYFIGTDISDASLPLSNLVIGETYLIRVHSDFAADDSYNPISSDYTFNVCVKSVNPPVNDNCTNAINIPVGNGFGSTPITATTLGATVEFGMTEADCAGDIANDVWFTVTVPTSGNVTIQSSAVSENEATDVVMEAYTGTCGVGLTLIDCNDDDNPDSYPSSAHSRISLTGQTPGEVIHIRMLPFDETQFGSIALTAWDESVLPAITTSGTCVSAPTVTIDSASGNLYRWVPILDATGNIVAELYADGNSLGTVSASTFINTGTVRQANGVYYLDRNITITPTVQPTSDVRVRFYLLEAELTALEAVDLDVTGLSDINFSKNSDLCQANVVAGTTEFSQDDNNTYGTGGNYVAFSVPSFSSIFARGGNIPLPVDVVFSGRNLGSYNELNWVASGVETGDYFELQRSANGKAFNKVEKTIGSPSITKYNYVDKEPFDGLTYYRLKVIGENGSSSYTKVITLSKKAIDVVNVSVYPNPANSAITVKVQGSENGLVTLSDISGRIISTTKMHGSELQIDMSSLSNGFYLVHYVDGNLNQVIKVNKQ